MYVQCRRCGHRNPPGVQFCQGPDCDAYLGWDGTRTQQPVTSRAGLEARLAEGELSVQPGDTCSVTVQVYNTGERVERVQVVVTGRAAAWSSVVPAELPVYPDKSATCTVTFAPPRRPDCPAGVVDFAVRCASTIHNGLVATAAGVVSVGAFHDLSMELQPTVSRGRRTTKHQVRVENRGNVRERLQLTTADAEGVLTFQPASVLVDAGPGTTEIPVTVRSRLRWFGRPVQVPLHAMAVPQPEGIWLRADGTRHVVALIPSWLLAAVLAVSLLGGGVATALQLTASRAPEPPPVAVPTTAQLPTPTPPTTAPPPTTSAQPPVPTTTMPTTQKPTPSTIKPATPVEPQISPEVCVPYEAGTLKLANAGALGFRVLAGTRQMLLLDNEFDARNALALAQRHKSECFFGKNSTRSNKEDFLVRYWRGSTGAQTRISPENCKVYDPAALRIGTVTRGGFPLDDSTQTLLLLDNEVDAKNALTWAKAFTKVCFIGAGNTRPDRGNYVVQYWLK